MIGHPVAIAADSYPSGPAADGLDQWYWEGLRIGELRVQRCRTCATWLSGARRICPSCLTFEPSWEAVEPIGAVYSWCRSHHPYLQELASYLPYTSVLVELPRAGGVRLLGMLDEDHEGDRSGDREPDRGVDTVRTEIAIGDRLQGVIRRPSAASWPVLRWSPVSGSTAVHR